MTSPSLPCLRTRAPITWQRRVCHSGLGCLAAVLLVAPIRAQPVTENARQALTPKSAEPDAQLSDSALEAELTSSQNEGFQRGVKLSGFMDFGLSRVFQANGYLKILDRNESFAIGHANVYLASDITRRLRSLLEVRFTYLPHGVDTNGDGQPNSNAVPDYTNISGVPTELGSIAIERAYGEYEVDPRLTVRFGHWLTPYGVWNVDHGSPTIIPIGVPFVISQDTFPHKQTGIDLFGSFDTSEYSTVQYHVTLSNGRGPYATYLDLDRNKAVGGRLQFGYQRFGDLSVGASFYYGKSTDAQRAHNQGAGPPQQITSQFDDVSLAADIKWDWKGLLLQAELVTQQTKYAEGGRYDVFFARTLPPDKTIWGAYGLVGSRIPAAELMPYIKVERLVSSPVELTSLAVGLNYRPLPELALKLELSRSIQTTFATTSTASVLSSQIAWAF